MVVSGWFHRSSDIGTGSSDFRSLNALSRTDAVVEGALPVTMPRLQVIHLRAFSCASCGAHLSKYLESEYSEATNPSTSTALKCPRATLPLFHSGVPQDRIILLWGQNDLGNLRSTLKELMSTSE